MYGAVVNPLISPFITCNTAQGGRSIMFTTNSVFIDSSIYSLFQVAPCLSLLMISQFLYIRKVMLKIESFSTLFYKKSFIFKGIFMVSKKTGG